MQGTGKISVAKPVASRPSSELTFYPHLTAEAMNSPTPSSLAEKTIAIKPKTVRFRPWLSVPEAVPSKCLLNGFASSEKASVTNLTADFGSSLLYKPTAKVVSATKAFPLANRVESYDANCHDGSLNMQAPVYELNLINQHTNQHQNSSSYADISQSYEPSSTASQDMELDMRIQHQSGDRLSYDGYNWRKYGQKQVKGSEYPRSYYKCTHPSCPVKKNVEMSLDGQIAEIVYKGEHNHPKPTQPLKKLSLSSQGQSIISDEQGREGGLLQTIPSGWNISAGMMNNCNEMEIHMTANCDGRTTDQAYKAGSRSAHVDGDKLGCKRRKECDQSYGANIDKRSEAAAGCNHMAQNPTDTDILGDGFHWRKYGQKVVKGNSYPRSYYRCTNPRCNVRKYVERVSDESGSFVTRYEGKHNHEMPNRK